MAIETFDIIVVGSGPAGVSTALHLQRLAPELAERTLIIEKARHPRHKLCGGGLTPLSQLALYRLGLDLDVPYLPVHEIQLRFENRVITHKQKNLILIIRRDRFDLALVAEARKRGIQVREGVALTGLKLDADWVLLETEQGPLRAKAVVGADGAKSVVRRHIVGSFAEFTLSESNRLRAGGSLWVNSEPSRVCRAIEILTPEDPETSPEFRDHRIVCDFSGVVKGLQGYVWDFPSMVEGRAFMNRGVFDSRVLPALPNVDLKVTFADYLGKQGRNLEDYKLMGNPGRWFDPKARYSVPRVLLVGDAAGIEPLGGDGISCALWYGDVAAAELAEAFASGDFDFTEYHRRLMAHDIGKYMAARTRQARFLYGIRKKQLFRAVWWYMSIRSRFGFSSF